MKITMNDYQVNGITSTKVSHELNISRSNDDLSKKMSEHELSELKIGLKLFLNCDDQDNVKDALDNGLLIISLN